MNKLPRFAREFANYIRKENKCGVNSAMVDDGIRNLFSAYEHGLITVEEMMRALTRLY